MGEESQLIIKDNTRETKRKQAEEALRESEERFQQIAGNIDEGFFLSAASDNSAIYVSPAYEKIWGRPVEIAYAHSKSWLEVVHPEDRVHVNACIEKHNRGKIAFSQEYRILRPNGTIRWVYDSVYPVKNESGEIYRIAGTTKDITERKKLEEVLQQAHDELEKRVEERTVELAKANKDLKTENKQRRKIENKLRKSEKQFRDIFENTLVGMYRTTPDGKIIMANSTLVRMLAHSSFEELSKRDLEDKKWYHPQHPRSEFKERLERDGQVIGLEAIWTKKDGSYLITRENARIVHDDDGDILYYEGTVEDFTERKRTEEEIIQLKENLQNIINSATDIIISFDKDNKVSTWNKQAEYITGFKQKKVIGKHISELKVFDNPRELLDSIQSIHEGKRPESDKLVLKTINHVKKIIKTSFSIVKGGNKQSIGSLLTGKDITNEIESHGKLLQGNSYLISDKNNKSALDLFIILTSPDCKGLWITRSDPEILKSTVSSRNIQTVVLKQNTARGFEHISNLERLTAKIKDFTEKNIKSVILLDRIDYLLSNFSFEQFIKSLYQITDIISENNSIFLLHLNPSVVDARQLAMVEGELRPLPGQKLEDIQIRDNYYDILKLVYEHNQNNSFISFKKISQRLSVNNKTIGKRIHDLEEKGLILIRKQGNLKTSFVSEKGKALLHKRNIL